MKALVRQLAAIVGERHCLTAPADLQPYLEEQRRLFFGNALAVVRPASTEEVARVVACYAAAGVPVVPQGGNTGVCGGGVPQGGAVAA